MDKILYHWGWPQPSGAGLCRSTVSIILSTQRSHWGWRSSLALAAGRGWRDANGGILSGPTCNRKVDIPWCSYRHANIYVWDFRRVFTCWQLESKMVYQEYFNTSRRLEAPRCDIGVHSQIGSDRRLHSIPVDKKSSKIINPLKEIKGI